MVSQFQCHFNIHSYGKQEAVPEMTVVFARHVQQEKAVREGKACNLSFRNQHQSVTEANPTAIHSSIPS